MVKIPNAALRFKPTRDQMVALMRALRRHARLRSSPRLGRRRSGGPGGSGGGAAPGMMAGPGGAGGPGGSGGDAKRDPDRRMLCKLVDGKPKMVFVKLGLTDGSTTELVEGDIQPGDQLITEIQGLAAARTAQDRSVLTWRRR